ncbi:MAG: lysylphosphatidylglycerol synthase transmembrane domain-containing protein [Thiotrichaceae bacterium]
MKSKRRLIIIGSLLSIILLILVFSQLDWQTFFLTLRSIQVQPLFFSILIVVFSIVLRAVRWNIIANMSLNYLHSFWQATNIGYLGNIIYPVRAGELLKIFAIHHFAQIPLGRAFASAVLDRVADVIMLGFFTLTMLWLHGNRLDPRIGSGVIGIFIITLIFIILLVGFTQYLQRRIQMWIISPKWQWLKEWLWHGLETLQSFQGSRHIVTVLLLTLTLFLLDAYWMWQVMYAFGWHLPFEAGITVSVFIVFGAALPSAPGYVGVYQLACLLALGLYDIDPTRAVAYSIILQLLSFAVMAIQGTFVTIYYGFKLSTEQIEN